MKLKPMRDCIFVRQDGVKEESEGGILLPDGLKKKPTTGIIVSMGPDVKDKDIKVGIRVLFGEFSGARELFNVNNMQNVQLLIMTEKDILAIQDEKEV